jgi:hypothetical protein
MEGYWLNHYFPNILKDSIGQMPSLESIEIAMAKRNLAFTEIEKYFIQPDLQDKLLYCGKQNPELHFDQKVRSGISSFSSLANKKEVEQGLIKPRRNIDCAKISEILHAFDNALRDYLFIIGYKASKQQRA